MENRFVSGVSVDKNIARISIINVNDEPGVVYRIYNCLALNHIKIDMIIQSGAKNGKQDISLTVSRPALQEALDVLYEHQSEFSIERVDYETGIAKLTMVGEGIANDPSVPAMLFEALFSAGVNIQSISTSEIRITILIDARDAERAMEAIQKAFHL